MTSMTIGATVDRVLQDSAALVRALEVTKKQGPAPTILGEPSESRDDNISINFSGLIDIAASLKVFQACGTELIKVAKTTLP